MIDAPPSATAGARGRGGAVLGAGGRDFAFAPTVLVAGPAALAREVPGRWEAPGAGGG
ncbi:hypothetical protein [Streptomyces chattanoogensis]|uniref:hypothetical protein n=1 Tax=Streptomyces chattanoogensis TaxID=66876 RepID=UPI003699B6BB